MLRSFKDNVLSRTPEGRELIRLFYFWNPLLVRAIEEDEDLRDELRETIDIMLPANEETEE